MKIKLSELSTTMLIPLWGRAMEMERKDALVYDSKAVEILNQIDYDFSKFSNARMSQVAVAVRSNLFDRGVNQFLDRNPKAVVLNLGAGLDTRFLRCWREGVNWYDLDLPEAIALRRKFLQETDSCSFLEGSILENDWITKIQRNNRSMIILAEGLLMYFTEEQVKSLLCLLADNFPEAEMLMEVTDYRFVGNARYHDALKKMDKSLNFRWGWNRRPEVLEAWHPAIHVLEDWNLFDYAKFRWGWRGWFVRLPFVRLTNGILRINFSRGNNE